MLLEQFGCRALVSLQEIAVQEFAGACAPLCRTIALLSWHRAIDRRATFVISQLIAIHALAMRSWDGPLAAHGNSD